MTKVKNYARFLLDNGLIFEINRKVLHPLGYALVVDVDPEDHRKIAIDGLYETDDPEGFIFDSEAFNEGQLKYNKFLKESGQSRIETRRDKIGIDVQEDEIIPNSEAIKQSQAIISWAKENSLSVEVDTDVLGGVAIWFNEAEEKRIWISCMNDGTKSILFYSGKETSSYSWDETSYSRILEFLNGS